MKKKFILSLLLMISSAHLLPASVVTATLAWDIELNPSGKTVSNPAAAGTATADVTLGNLTSIAILTLNAEYLTDENIRTAQEVMSIADAEFMQDDFTGEGNIAVTSNGATGFEGSFTEGDNYFIVVVDNDNKWFASNALTAFTTAGWVNTPTGVNSPGYVWQPAADQSDAWTTAGYNYSPVPEPASGLMFIIGAAALFYRRRR